MCSYWRRLWLLSLCALFAIGIDTLASAQTQQTINYGANLGSLSYYLQKTPKTCSSQYGPFNYTIYTFYNFVFIPATGSSQPISGSTYCDVGIGGRLIGSGNCPYYISGGTVIYANGNTYTINITPHNNGTLTSGILVPGYINPKYIVVGIIYAPPGHLSNVDYLSSDLVNSTVSTKSTYTSRYTEGTAVMTSNHVEPFKGGTIDSSSKASTSYTQTTTTTDSTAVTVQKMTSTSLESPDRSAIIAASTTTTTSSEFGLTRCSFSH